MAIRVVIIDDNPHITQSLRDSFDWKSLGCIVSGTANDGEEGKRLIRDCQPEIIITDIRMPNLDGFEMLEQCRSRNTVNKVIIITGYQEFRNAQKALKQGAFDLLLKPIDDDVLFEVITAALKSLRSDREEKQKILKVVSEKENMKARLEGSLPSMRSEFLHDLLNCGGSDEEYCNRRMKEVGIRGNRFILFFARFAAELDRDLPRIKREIDEGGKDDTCLYISALNETGLITVVFFNALESLSRETLRRAYLKLLNGVLGTEEEKEGLLLTASQIYPKLSYIPRAFHEAVFASQERFFHFLEKARNPAGPLSLGTSGNKTVSLLRSINTLGDTLLRSGKEEQARALDIFSQQVRDCCKGDLSIARVLFSELCIHLYRKREGANGFEDGDDALLDDILIKIQKAGDARETGGLLASYLVALRTRSNCGQSYSHLVESILNYVKANATADVSLRSVAVRFKITAPYLCGLIKKETGINFTGWVAKFRIEAAKEILRDPLMKVSEVGERIGIRDYAYFYHVFRKIEGISPTEYKKRLNRKN